jgi:hypothetical protein
LLGEDLTALKALGGLLVLTGAALAQVKPAKPLRLLPGAAAPEQRIDAEAAHRREGDVQAQGEEAYVPGGGEPEVAGLPGRGTEASAVYLQATPSALQEGEEE